MVEWLHNEDTVQIVLVFEVELEKRTSAPEVGAGGEELGISGNGVTENTGGETSGGTVEILDLKPIDGDEVSHWMSETVVKL